MAEDLETLKKELEEEREKRKKLENEFQEKEKKFTGQYQRLLQVEQGIISGEEALRTIEREHIETLTYHLRKEHKSRAEAEEKLRLEREKFDEGLNKEREKTEDLEKKLKDISDKLETMKGEVKDKNKTLKDVEAEGWNKLLTISGLASDIDLGVDKRSESWVVETQDLLKLLVRIGKVKISDATQILDLEEDKLLKYAKILKKKGLANIENPNSNDPTLSATKNLIKRVSAMKTRLRKKGRIIR